MWLFDENAHPPLLHGVLIVPTAYSGEAGKHESEIN
jgi:hypothetical protein